MRFFVSIVAVLFVIDTTQATDSPKTNVLFIYVEDWGYFTSERAAREPNAVITGLKTPNVDAFAKQGVTFTRAFCGQSVCSPSKAAIYSGLHAHANGIWRNVHNDHPKFGGPEKWIPLPNPLTKDNDPTFLAVPGMHEDLPNMVQSLKAKGVYCALSGKLHVQPARHFPYDVFVDTGDLGSVIKNAGDKPWFFWCNPGDTHAPFWSHVKNRGKLSNPKDRNSAPTDVDPKAITMPPWLPDTPASRIDVAQYYSCIQTIDDFVGSMLKKLQESGQADRTVVVITGDHGIPVQRGKMSVYPAGTQVPCYIRGPGVKGERILSAPISQIDFNPTFIETFGAKPLPESHGKSLWPVLSGKLDAVPNRLTIMTETNHSSMSQVGSRGDLTAARAVCDGRYYYILNVVQEKSRLPEDKALFVGSGFGEYGDPGPQYAIDLHDETVRQKEKQPVPYELLRKLVMGDAPKEELFDLDADPWAVKDLASDPAHAKVLARMRDEMTTWRKATADRDAHPKTIPMRKRK
ncbi:MAG: sulfatase-like hydrolase/transferase [Fimbriiglobus sp.]